MRSFEGGFRNLKFSPSTSILLNFFFPFIDIKCFFLKFKIQTIVLLNKLKLLKKPLFQKRRWSCDFPPRKTRLPKSTARFPAKKRWHSPLLVGLPWDFPPPPPVSVRAYADMTTKIFQIDRLPNFLSNGAPLAGFARRLRYYVLIGIGIVNSSFVGHIPSSHVVAPKRASFFPVECNVSLIKSRPAGFFSAMCNAGGFKCKEDPRSY